MKTSVLFAILLFPALLFGQTINHYNQPDSRWNVAKTYPAASQENPSFAATETTVFGIEGDTMINSENWFKLYSTTDSLFLNDLVYRGLVRSENNRVLYSNTLNQVDTLYDFNLVVGDSVLFNLFGTNPTWHHIISVDNMLINGEYYKRQIFDEQGPSAFSDMKEVWIEGIGSIHGPLFPSSPVKFSGEIPDSTLLTCSFSNNQYLWKHLSYANCYTNITLGVDNPEIQNFSFYPNPFKDEVFFKNNESSKLKLIVLNSLGQVVKQVQLSHDLESIDLSELTNGIYVFKFSDQNNVRTEKVIKGN